VGKFLEMTMEPRRQFLRWTAATLGYPWIARSDPARVILPPGVPAIGHRAALPETQSDVGSLFSFIESQRAELSLSFLRPEFTDLLGWKRQARGKLLELLHYNPPACAANPVVLERVDRGEYVQEMVLFNTTPDLRVPGIVLVPSKLQRPAPGIVALHDHGGFYLWGKEKLVATEDEHPVLTDFRNRYYAGRSIAPVLARQGYVVLVIDMFYWGERRMLLDADPVEWRDRPRAISPESIAAFNRRASESEQLVGRTLYAAGLTWPGIMFWDDIRSVDYLVSRPEVDAGRIGCVGLSVGGLRACHLAALDDRIKAAVVVGWMASFPAQLRRHIRYTIGHTKLVPGLYRYLDYPDVASLALPSALLIINGSKDTLFEPDGVQAAFQKLEACYRKAGVPERLRTRLYDTPHEFNAAMQAEAWEWLGTWL
jgi:dienelactone hydrolase